MTTQEGQSFADSKGAIFVEASAKKGVGVQGAFDDLVHRVSDRGGSKVVVVIVKETNNDSHSKGNES